MRQPKLLVFVGPLLVVLLACGGQEKVVSTSLQSKVAASAACTVPSPCWMTAGGTKFEPVVGLKLADHGPKVSFGGNVAPSCSLEPGEGGQWNHVDHDLKLHFQGFSITDVYCTLDLPATLDSPDTTVNHIFFSGTGRLQGISGNKVSYEDVCFTAQAVDRAEPGSKGQSDPAYVDEYFLRVTDCAGNTLLSLGDETSLIDITGGNVQIHPCK